jgi:hypothetical protein
MLTSAITRVVDFCTRYPLWIIVLFLGLATGSSFYAARHFAIKTDVYDLLSPDLPWNRDRSRFLRDFPQREILVVVDAPTAELAGQASAKLAAALREHPDQFRSVSHPGSGSFYERNGLLFLPTAEVERLTTRLSRGDRPRQTVFWREFAALTETGSTADGDWFESGDGKSPTGWS